MNRRHRWFMACLLLALLGGCNQRTNALELFPAVGELWVDGKPATGATIRLIPIEGTVNKLSTPAATVDESGRFAVSSLKEGDGAPAGNYAVVVYWLVTPVEGGLPTDRFRGRFVDPRAPAAKVTIEKKENRLGRIELSTASAP